MDRRTAETILDWLPAKVSAIPQASSRSISSHDLVAQLDACKTKTAQIDVLMGYLSTMFGTFGNGIAADCKPVQEHWERMAAARGEAA